VRASQFRRVNQLLAAGRFAPMTTLKLPFTADDFNFMTLEASGVVIRYEARGTLSVDRNGSRVAMYDVPTTGECAEPLIRELFLDEKTHTLAAEFQYRECSDPPGAWSVLRFH
jgi:hypothetical protein